MNPTEAVEELHDTLASVPENTEDFEEVVDNEDEDSEYIDDEDDIDALDGEDNISYDESDLDNFEDDENYVGDDLEPEEELNFGEAVRYLKKHGYALNENTQMLSESLLDNLDQEDRLFIQRTIDVFG